jgi:putative transposase
MTPINPFRAGIVETVQALKAYRFTGHCALMGKKEILWQDTAYVLALFGKTVTDARTSYADFVSKYAGAGRRPELTGGGLIRSAGGWRAIKEAYEAGIRLTSDERILGSSSFVEKTLASVGEDYDQRMRLKASGIDLYPNVAKAGGIQSQACYIAVSLELKVKRLYSF